MADKIDQLTLPTGTISLSQVNTELGHSATHSISLGQADVRALAGKTSGAISMSDLHGKSSAYKFVFKNGHTTDTSFNITYQYYGFSNGTTAVKKKYGSLTSSNLSTPSSFEVSSPLVIIAQLSFQGHNVGSLSTTKVRNVYLNGSRMGNALFTKGGSWNGIVTPQSFTCGYSGSTASGLDKNTSQNVFNYLKSRVNQTITLTIDK